MFRETDVPVRTAGLSPPLPHPPLLERVTPLIGELPLGCDEKAPPLPHRLSSKNKRLRMSEGGDDALLALFASAELK